MGTSFNKVDATFIIGPNTLITNIFFAIAFSVKYSLTLTVITVDIIIAFSHSETKLITSSTSSNVFTYGILLTSTSFPNWLAAATATWLAVSPIESETAKIVNILIPSFVVFFYTQIQLYLKNHL